MKSKTIVAVVFVLIFLGVVFNMLRSKSKVEAIKTKETFAEESQKTSFIQRFINMIFGTRSSPTKVDNSAENNSA